MIKKVRQTLIKFLEEYSPLALLVIVLPFFIPLEREMTRRLLLLFCAAPGFLVVLINPKAIFKNPVLLLMLLFAGYFSAQHLRGMLPLNTHILRMALTTAVQIIGPALLLSRISPDRKLFPVVIRLILLAITLRVGYELIHFYSEAPFPLARFAGMGHPVSGSRFMGFSAVLAGAIFLQNGPCLRRWDWLALICLPLLLAATFYTHTRSTALALLITTGSAVLCIKSRMKKVIILYTVIAATFFVYAGTSLLAPKPPPRVKRAKPSSEVQTAQAQVRENTTQSEAQKPKKRGKRYDLRRGGVLTTSKGGQVCTFARFYIWRDHLSRMTTPKHWLIGHGLGMKAFEKDIPDPKASRWYLRTPHGYQLHVHSIYIWALYHGGIVGLGILLLLMASAAGSALRAGPAGYAAFSLLLYLSVSLLTNGNSLLSAWGSPALFWMSIGLAAGFPLFHKRAAQKNQLPVN